MELCGKKHETVFSANESYILRKTLKCVFCKSAENIEIRFFQNQNFAEENMKLCLQQFAEKNTTLKGKYFPRIRVVSGVGMDGLKAQPARSLPLPR